MIGHIEYHVFQVAPFNVFCTNCYFEGILEVIPAKPVLTKNRILIDANYIFFG